MSAPTIEDLKKAIGDLSPEEKLSLAEWMNISAIREELQEAERQIENGAGLEYNESNLSELFLESRSSALQLLRERASK
ncbi:MAG: hypothetical protein ABL967_14765 [Bryobacteraceae bacterium]